MMLNNKSWKSAHAYRLSVSLILVGAFAVTGCSVTPSSIVQQPTTARPKSIDTSTNSNGAIFNVATYRPAFEDRRPRFIGDIVTINIVENTSATKANGSSAAKEGSASFNTDSKIADNLNLPIIGGVLGSIASKVPFADKSSFSASSDNSYADKAAANSSNVFTGSITATVVDVLPNGYLMVSGEKQVAFDKGTEFVRFSGVVNPDMITQGNNVPSTKVADARIEYRTNTKIDAASIASVFARFFLSMSPW